MADGGLSRIIDDGPECRVPVVVCKAGGDTPGSFREKGAFGREEKAVPEGQTFRINIMRNEKPLCKSRAALVVRLNLLRLHAQFLHFLQPLLLR